VAPDADAALDEMSQAAADVVMCDVEMPGHDGLWLAAQLHKRFPASAIVLATALDSVPPITSMQPGIVEYLVKPFVQKRVLNAVARGMLWHATSVGQAPEATRGADALSHWLEATED
jgi:FixJ family two-component response regulator